MKRVKLMLSAFAVLAIVGSALAFKVKSFGLGNISCFATTATVTTNESCDHSGQPAHSDQFDYTSTGGSLSNPCAGITGETQPYVDVPGTSCTSVSSSLTTFQNVGN